MSELPGPPPSAGRPPVQLRDPVVLAAFEGWNDAGESASQAIAHLHRVWDAQELAEFDPEEYHDFQVNRPTVHLDEDGRRKLVWPTTRVSWARPPDSARDVLLVQGIEPSMRWKTYAREFVSHVQAHGASLVVTLGALLADVPHTRPLPVTSTSEDEDLLERLAIERSRYEGPTGIVGVVQEFVAAAGIPALSLWAAIPHYVGQPPSPKGTLALLHRVEELLEIAIPLEDLPEDARAWEHGVDELAEEDSEIAEYVQQLEEAKDTAELPEASGEAIAREFERYLRRRDDGPRRG